MSLDYFSNAGTLHFSKSKPSGCPSAPKKDRQNKQSSMCFIFPFFSIFAVCFQLRYFPSSLHTYLKFCYMSIDRSLKELVTELHELKDREDLYKLTVENLRRKLEFLANNSGNSIRFVEEKSDNSELKVMVLRFRDREFHKHGLDEKGNEIPVLALGAKVVISPSANGRLWVQVLPPRLSGIKQSVVFDEIFDQENLPDNSITFIDKPLEKFLQAQIAFLKENIGDVSWGVV
jgi:hypothetical protein